MPPGPKSFVRSTDLMQITPDPTPPWVAPSLAAPIPLIGSSTDVMVEGMPACLMGDEAKPPILNAPIPYTAPGFTVPGTVKLVKIIIEPNLSKQCNNGGKPMILMGTTFKATFSVASPAVNESSGVPDPVVAKTATCKFTIAAALSEGA